MKPKASYQAQHPDFEISIYSRDQAHFIDLDNWKKLSSESIFENPFFQPDWLSLSLKFLQREDDVYVVTAEKNGNLACLFPIQISSKFGLRYFNIWQHNHAFDNTPLVINDFDFKELVNKVCILLDCQWGRIHLHHPSLIENLKPNNGKQYKFQRAFISNTSEIDSKNRTGKFHRENQRLLRKAKQDLDIEFFEYTNINLGLNDYSKLEHKGWKGVKSGSILSLNSTKNFYSEIFKSSWGIKSISVFGLNSINGIIACAIRINSNSSIFEIKTTYSEDYYQYAPGRILEVFLLKNLATYKNLRVDSCTSQDNRLINRLWDEQATLHTSIIYSESIIGGLVKKVYLIKKFIFR